MSHFEKQEVLLQKESILENAMEVVIALPFVISFEQRSVVRGYGRELKIADLVFTLEGEYDIGFDFGVEEVISFYHADDETRNLFCNITKILLKETAKKEAKRFANKFLERNKTGKVFVLEGQSVNS